MTFHVGQKVVYVGGPRHPKCWTDLKEKLQIGSVYTIREIDDGYIPHYECVGIRVEEESYKKMRWAGGECEPATLAYKFRPIIERKTDISIFTEILRKVTRKDRVKA